MKIGGLVKTTLLDFPGHIACSVYLQGCNFRCPYCHNATLVLPERMSKEEMSEATFFDFLSRRVGILDGVCISGGEPLIFDDLEAFIRRIRTLGFKVKLDTNGSFPDRLQTLLRNGLIDYVAMDLKNAPDDYAQTCGIERPPMEDIRESLAILADARIPYELRTTVVAELHDEDKLRTIAHWVGDVPRYFLQSYIDSDGVIEKGFNACSPSTLAQYLKIVQEIVPSAQLRGV